MLTKDGRDTPIGNLTPDNYIVPKGEEKDYHAVIEVVQYDTKTGKKISKPRVQKFGRKTFEQSVQATLRKQGYAITILHDPNKWIAEQQAKAAQLAKEAAEAKAKAEQERFDKAVNEAVNAKLDAAVAAAVAKALAERDTAGTDTGKKSGRQAKEQPKE